ncbi:cell division transport system permease protein [Antricoccus suffuscus]|uniref:Cell division protein FtsX n=1 Tax=Antricoccus suffuscus TaxID=1629062 RepID=A0A2T0YYN6_9ACTN|nr:permease-like cell division protein FtsX [Antricoccus suffuscus]PRZ29018.1 cell division transport system permease protein [Antricoccus suffuscus]
MRLKFILSEVAAGLRRNLTMTIAMILTTAISLGLLGAGLLIAREISAMKTIYYDKVQVSIFLTQDVTAEQKQGIEKELDKLKSDGEVKNYFSESRDEAYKRFKKQFAAQPELVQNTPKEALPESYRVSLVNAERYDIIKKSFTEGKTADGQPKYMAGVDTVRDEGQVLDRLFSVLNGLRNATIAIAAAGAIAALLLISNTVQLAAFTRRTETGIMRLVGASRWYTQVPFVIEAAVAGIFGAALAVGGLFVTKALLIERSFASMIKSGTIPPITAGDIWAVSPLMIAAGALLAAVTAWVTLRLYVRQ